MAVSGSHRIGWQRGHVAVCAEASVAVERQCTADGAGLVRGMDAVGEPWRTGVMFRAFGVRL
jgi:hypothetical protein